MQNAVIPANAVTMADNGQSVTSSRIVAEVFGKEHRDVLKRIRNIEVPLEWGVRNFAQSSYINAQNKEQPEYQITKDGFVLLVMGFTGKKAMAFKLAYIEAFNKMERALNRQPDPTSIEGAIIRNVIGMAPLEQARLLVAMETKQFPKQIAKLAAPKPQPLPAPTADGLTGYNVTGLRRLLREMGVRKSWVASARRDVLIMLILHEGSGTTA